MRLLCCALLAFVPACRCNDRPAPVDAALGAAEASAPVPEPPTEAAAPRVWEELDKDLSPALGGWGKKDEAPWVIIQSRDENDLVPPAVWDVPYYYRLFAFLDNAHDCTYDCGMFKNSPQVGYCLKDNKRVVTRVVVSKSGSWIKVRVGDEQEFIIRNDP